MPNIDLAIDPFNLDGPWDERRLQAWFIFGACVPGKSAKQTAEKVTHFIEAYLDPLGYTLKLPFDSLRYAFTKNKNYVKIALMKVRMGQYERINKALLGLSKINPRTVTLEQLESIHGIGPKTARMLLLYTRPGFKGVPLDTHILKYLKAQGVKNVPKATPSSKREYNRLEAEFYSFASIQGKTVRELDTEVWKSYAEKK
jgi:thermostable 8-oxoguanine DNA glycosylase